MSIPIPGTYPMQVADMNEKAVRVSRQVSKGLYSAIMTRTARNILLLQPLGRVSKAVTNTQSGSGKQNFDFDCDLPFLYCSQSQRTSYRNRGGPRTHQKAKNDYATIETLLSSASRERRCKCSLRLHWRCRMGSTQAPGIASAYGVGAYPISLSRLANCIWGSVITQIHLIVNPVS